MFDKEMELASELEDIALLAKTMSNEIRDGVEDPYARVYWLRHRLSKSVAKFGMGFPANQAQLTKHYESLLSDGK